MKIENVKIDDKKGCLELANEIRIRTEIKSTVIEETGDILENVRLNGDAALCEYSYKFDGIRIEPHAFEIPYENIAKAWDSIGDELQSTMKTAANRVAKFSESSLSNNWEKEMRKGLLVGEVKVPVRRAGIYIPGGRFAYPSTVLMAGMPARTAGVEEIVFCVPPDPDGNVNPYTLAAMKLTGECKTFKIGGAHAIAAMAFGTETIPKCDVIAGPGNAYVTAAKRLVYPYVRLDTEAGPSEIAILVDNEKFARIAVLDATAQLEHDPFSISMIVCISSNCVDAVRDELAQNDNLEGVSYLIQCDDEALAVDFINAFAPEHLLLLTESPKRMFGSITSAGCVFLGPYSAVALGDYIAGPSHVLPTGGKAAMFSGLNPGIFRRVMNFVQYSKEAFEADSGHACTLARIEGLERHAYSIESREE
ncbi:MAG: histidinol dehydrogenase [Actinomycetota bacterium]|nr:histidinol dehydrogenase [Actinomycetota bacterium]